MHTAESRPEKVKHETDNLKHEDVLNKGLKISLIIILAITGLSFTLALIICNPYIFNKVRIWRLTRDMTGGTSIIYEIDTTGMSEEQKKNLSQKMILVLQKRVDPQGVRPIVWRPLSDTRFEIQIPPDLKYLTAKDIQRMLKGAGILEFRILPTEGHPDVDMAAMNGYLERLQEKGPKQASDKEYIWCEIENFVEWRSSDSQQRPTIVGTLGDKYYVLASNKAGQVMLHSPGTRDWKLDRVYPTSDHIGRRAIGFVMDYIGGKLMAEITGNNTGRPLCILLDDIAISAPCIEERIPGRGIITGNFTETETADIINKLNAGSLPAKLIEKPVVVKTIDVNIGS